MKGISYLAVLLRCELACREEWRLFLGEMSFLAIRLVESASFSFSFSFSFTFSFSFSFSLSFSISLCFASFLGVSAPLILRIERVRLEKEGLLSAGSFQQEAISSWNEGGTFGSLRVKKGGIVEEKTCKLTHSRARISYSVGRILSSMLASVWSGLMSW